MSNQFLLLWSGHIPDMRKVKVQGVKPIGVVGATFPNGEYLAPDRDAVREALPERLREPFDRSSWGYTRHVKDAPIQAELRDGDGNHIALLYLQPLTKQAEPPRPDWHIVAWTLNNGNNDLPDFWTVEESEEDARRVYDDLLKLDNLHCATVAKMTDTRTDWMQP